ncbi:2Fe-2S iron-sulfur cluster binding domain-containing protein [Gilvimarinus agarilyticus]|uniref:2Fe-2S iron-sulfur cluster-binding protein n=1 Tax=Gilvimarinus sp. 2_MG-2023 TaxID=3062666 RepID=UPI001C097BF7|nr:2Fe-2S iron-sulfur cluster binding domain-containing protein [Gilvimarinus sp. 2_MG-2023]MBU2887553.1 2Fe-2S iron-sulfur cluster binding domain-containing protein [Gilvimarinus agarilyticus]MDO6572204.1 2Fe-2S iron-sulfur cluster binding domain-containing protein [Gilvimarinus sp. 2_MG-2023]
MSKLTFENQTLIPGPGQSVLDTLLQAGVQIPHSCKQGVCQSCLIQVGAGEIPAQAQAGLKAGQISKGLMLSCSCYPQSDLKLQRYNPKQEMLTTRVVSKRMLRPDVLELKLDGELKYQAGQYVTLWRNDTIARSFSLASQPTERFLSFHIDVRPNGQFSQWAAQTLQLGDSLSLQGPLGDCVYQSEAATPLLLAATGTGAGTLTALAKEALTQGHTGPIHFLMCARHFQSMYWQHEINKLARQHSHFQPRFLALEGTPLTGGEIADVYPLIRQEFAPLNNVDVYLCGAASFVNKMRKQCFLAGVKPRNVFCDAFEPGG